MVVVSARDEVFVSGKLASFAHVLGGDLPCKDRFYSLQPIGSAFSHRDRLLLALEINKKHRANPHRNSVEYGRKQTTFCGQTLTRALQLVHFRVGSQPKANFSGISLTI